MDMVRLLAMINLYPDDSTEQRAKARKFMQMGYTRARRYANHRGGKKYVLNETSGKREEIDRLAIEDQEPDKVKAALVFQQALETLKSDAEYSRLRTVHLEAHESKPLNLDGIEILKGVPEKRGGEAKGELGKKTKRAKKT